MEEVKGYNKQKLTIDLVRANIVGICSVIPISLIFGLPYYLIWKDQFTINNLRDYLSGLSPMFIGSAALLVFFMMIAGIVVHELVHGISWAFYTKRGFRSIKFGVLWKMLTPYCHCREPLRVKQYIIGAITPGIVVGIIPAVVAIFTGSLSMLIFGIFFTMAASGDLMIINLLRNEKSDDLVLDHPSEAGCYIYRKISGEDASDNGGRIEAVETVS